MPLALDENFPGGNIIIEDVANGAVRMRQRLDGPAEWFYWQCRVQGAQGQRICFTMMGSRAIGTRGPAVSYDDGKTWQWLGHEVVDGKSFTVDFPTTATSVRLSFGMPYVESHWRRFIAQLQNADRLQAKTLCETPQGRPVEMLELPASNETRFGVVITCRHHCCEMMTNYTLEGVIHWLLNTPEGEHLNSHSSFLIVPFVDKDGVENGDQGKNRPPHDHNRDYGGASIYATTRAIRQHVPEWARGKRLVGLDLHCPYISGPNNECTYLVGQPEAAIAREQLRFSELLEKHSTSHLPFHAQDFVPYGEGWNQAENFAQGLSFAHWFTGLPKVLLSTTIELPYATAHGEEVNADTARAFGGDLGKTLAHYLPTPGQ